MGVLTERELRQAGARCAEKLRYSVSWSLS